MDIIEKTRTTIEKHAMFGRGSHVLTALSGGPDSVCLLHVLYELRHELGITLSAAYVDHGLRPAEVPAEIGFCRSLCNEKGIEFIVKHIEVKSSPLIKKLGLQGAARELRYRVLEEAASIAGADCIALAHHSDDQAETLLLNLLRGTGMQGLRGMLPVRGPFVRPLLCSTREEIEAYLASRGISCVTDPSNLKGKYRRNRIRMHILPELRKMNPGIAASLSRTAEIITQEDAYLESEVTKTLMRLFSRKRDRRVELFLSPLEGLHPVILRRALRRAVAEVTDLKSLSYSHIEDIIGLIRHGNSGDRLYLPRGLRVIREYSVLVMTTENPVRLGTYSLDAGQDLYIEEAGLVLKASVVPERRDCDGRYSAIFDLSRLSMPLLVRGRRPGDYFFPSGFGRRKKLQDYFVDEKVPRDERDAVPLICSGKDIIWVLGYRTDSRFLPAEDSGSLLLITSRPARR